MASIAFEEYKNKLNNLRPALDDLGGALHLDEARNEVDAARPRERVPVL